MLAVFLGGMLVSVGVNCTEKEEEVRILADRTFIGWVVKGELVQSFWFLRGG